MLAGSTLLVALPIAAASLNAEQLGVWTLLVSSMALLGFADLGLGNGLLNALSECLARGNLREARRVIAGALVGLGLLSTCVGALGFVTVSRVPWAGLLGVDERSVPDLDLSVGVVAAAITVNIISGVGQRIHLAMQKGWVSSAFASGGSLLALGGVVLAGSLDAGLPWFVAAMLGAPALALLLESIYVLALSHRELRPRPSDFDVAVIVALVQRGLLFFVLAAAGAVGYQTDAIVIAYHLGAEEVTPYGVSHRLFMLAPVLLTPMLVPLWPAYSEAMVRRDIMWVRTALRRSVLIAAASSAIGALVMLVAARPIAALLAAGAPSPSMSLLLALSVWSVVVAVSMALAMYLNGTNLVRVQAVLAAIMAAANLAVSLVLVGPLGAAGPVWASVITQLLIVVVPVSFLVAPAWRGSVGSDRARGGGR